MQATKPAKKSENAIYNELHSLINDINATLDTQDQTPFPEVEQELLALSSDIREMTSHQDELLQEYKHLLEGQFKQHERLAKANAQLPVALKFQTELEVERERQRTFWHTLKDWAVWPLANIPISLILFYFLYDWMNLNGYYFAHWVRSSALMQQDCDQMDEDLMEFFG